MIITGDFFFLFAGSRILDLEGLMLLRSSAFNVFNLKINTPKKNKNKIMIGGLGNAISCWE